MRRFSRRAIAATLAIGLAVATVGAQPSGAATGSVVLPPLPKGHASLDPDLGGVVVDSAHYRVVAAAYDASVTAYQTSTAVIADSTNQISHLTLAAATLDSRVRAAVQSRAVVGKQVATLEASRRQLAVRSYIDGGGSTPFDILNVGEVTDAGTNLVLTETADKRTRADESAAKAHYAAADHTVRDVTTQRTAVRDRLTTQTDRHTGAIAAQNSSAADIAVRQQDYDDARAQATVKRTNLTLVALDAYWKAAKAIATDQPQCGIKWWALAGIGQVESHQGTYAGSTLDPSGETSKRIIGIPLDGQDGTAAIGDTDHGALDGDPNADHAVGPMQFIPSTWKMWGRDGNGDGVKDPNNLYDAALAAAAYLCHSGRLTTSAALTQAYLSYNASPAYAQEVLGYALGYAKFVIPPAPPANPIAAAALAQVSG